MLVLWKPLIGYFANVWFLESTNPGVKHSCELLSLSNVKIRKILFTKRLIWTHELSYQDIDTMHHFIIPFTLNLLSCWIDRGQRFLELKILELD